MISKIDAQIYALKRVDVKDSEDADSVFDSYGKQYTLYTLYTHYTHYTHVTHVTHVTANEISLLNRLKGSRHIIELIDYEVRKDHMYVAMLLEVGDVDLAKVLNQTTSQQQQGMGKESALAALGSGNSIVKERVHLDPFFCRMVWKEMLLAVHHIHNHRIVHGDLKPANFVFVKGHLKLIDFGIAKSFSSDTTNIYRESQIGTVSTNIV